MKELLTRVEQELNQLWQKQLPIIQLENNVEENTPIVQLAHLDKNQSIVVHTVKEIEHNWIMQTQPSAELAVFASARLCEDYRTLIREKGPRMACELLRRQVEKRCQDVLTAAGYHYHQNDAKPNDILRTYGNIKGLLEMSPIKVVEKYDHARLRTGFMAIVNVTMYVAKPKDVLSLAIINKR